MTRFSFVIIGAELKAGGSTETPGFLIEIYLFCLDSCQQFRDCGNTVESRCLSLFSEVDLHRLTLKLPKLRTGGALNEVCINITRSSALANCCPSSAQWKASSSERFCRSTATHWMSPPPASSRGTWAWKYWRLAFLLGRSVAVGMAPRTSCTCCGSTEPSTRRNWCIRRISTPGTRMMAGWRVRWKIRFSPSTSPAYRFWCRRSSWRFGCGKAKRIQRKGTTCQALSRLKAE